MPEMSRRRFVKNSGILTGTALAYSTLPSTVLGANDKINVGVIGVRNMGNSNAKDFVETGRAHVTAFADVDRQILDKRINEFKELTGKAPKAYDDYRKMLEQKDLDAIVVATPDHWHIIQAIEAMQAGKDIYVEKPCCHNVNECRQIAIAADKYGRIVQHGTQQRSGTHFQQAKEYVQSGKLGKIAMLRTWGALGRDSIGRAQPQSPPPHLDYDFWLGPAPEKPYTENRCHYNWRFLWDYGTGDMGNWGVHWIDTALWSMNLGWPKSVTSSGGKYIFDDDKETPDTQYALYEYDDLMMVWELRMWSQMPIENKRVGTAFYGDEQTLVVDRSGFEVYTQDGKELITKVESSNDMGVAHKHNFIDCMQDRKAPIADINDGHISAAVAIMGNVAILAGEKIHYNSGRNLLNEYQYNHLLTREYRPEYPMPKI
ncbi:gfo/Idh/MocA family oxidoreductase [candidate division KSB1 bacterium]|nr:gfo/Idh/MocA family oxidoreductase [candidate division KSB1 bacterium]